MDESVTALRARLEARERRLAQLEDELDACHRGKTNGSGDAHAEELAKALAEIDRLQGEVAARELLISELRVRAMARGGTSTAMANERLQIQVRDLEAKLAAMGGSSPLDRIHGLQEELDEAVQANRVLLADLAAARARADRLDGDLRTARAWPEQPAAEEPVAGFGIDLELLRKIASGEGGRRTGVLMRAGYITCKVTEAGHDLLDADQAHVDLKIANHFLQRASRRMGP